MSILDQLAAASGRKDEELNIQAARHIAAAHDAEAVSELVQHLRNKNKDIQSDCIKTLYETAALNPELVLPHLEVFVDLLHSKNNRLQWGAMTALHQLTPLAPDRIYSVLPQLAQAADKGSVITRDHYVAILTQLCTVPAYAPDAFSLLNEQLLSCPANQLPMYAENALPVIHSLNKSVFIKTLSARLGDFEKESKRKRVEKVLKKTEKI